MIERLVDSFARRIGKDPADVRRMNLHPPHDADIDHGLERRLGELRTSPRQGARPRGVRQAARRATRPARARRRTQLGIGLLHLHRDVRARAVEHPGGAAIRGRRLGRSHDRMPALRSRDRQDRHVTHARATRPHGPRSWPTASASPRTRSRCSTRTPIRPHSATTYGSRSVAVGGVALHFAVEKIEAKARTTPRTSWRWPRTTSNGATARSA